MKELLPVINYRIYKTCSSVWNFNPNPASKLGNIKANLFTEKVRLDGVWDRAHNLITARTSIEFVKVPGTEVPHLALIFNGFRCGAKQYSMVTNLTSNSEFNPDFVCQGTPAHKNPQAINHTELICSESLVIDTSRRLTGFQLVVNEIGLFEAVLTQQLLFNLDSTGNSYLCSISDHLINQGIIFSPAVKPLFIGTDIYTQDMNRFLTLNKFTALDLRTSKHLLISNICPELTKYTTSYQFSNKPGKLLILPDTELIL
tara:strand:+ start:163 stop:936 length:774 start_codon:yes stop_codon:yes gene_type:complete